jgi:hypothetical protein
MPLPAAPDSPPTPTSVLVALLRQLHQQLREELVGLTDDAVGWAPLEGANSIAVLVTHLLGSEAESLSCVAGLEVTRDRELEFVPAGTGVKELLGLVEAADTLLDRLAPKLTADRLAEEISLPTLPPRQSRPGVTWLVGNYGHAREHLGQIQLTKQLHAKLRP